MNNSIPYNKIVTRFFFVLILLGILVGPQLFSNHPRRVFAIIQNILQSRSVWFWILILVGVLFILWVFSNINKTKITEDSNELPVMRVPIGEAVKQNNGGSGLASMPFQPSLKFLNVLGWINVKDPDKECIIIDGQHTINSTKLFFAPMILFGKPVNARRVLLSPSPLEDISAKALTNDQLELTLVVTIKYTVINPIYVASLSAPLTELTNVITGILVERIHSSSLEDIVKDDGTLRQAIKIQLEKSDSIHNHYRIDGVLKALPTGDERIIEIIRKTREAFQSRALIEQEGQNREVSADYDIRIKRAEAELQEEFIQKDHERELEILRIKQEYETLLEFTRSIAQIAASGVNPAPAIKEIRALFTEGKPNTPAALPKSTDQSLLEIERNNLSIISEKIGIKSFEIHPNPDSIEQPGKSLINFEDFSIQIDCTSDYPSESPMVKIETGNNENTVITIPWYEGSNLVDATTAAMMQVRIQHSRKSRKSK